VVLTQAARAGWRLESLLSDSGQRGQGRVHRRDHASDGARDPDPRRTPQTHGNVDALHMTILDECRRPPFAR
jgi:hypothetical protein